MLSKHSPYELVSVLSKHSEQLVSHDVSAVPKVTGGLPQWGGRLLVGDDEPRLLSSLCSILRTQGFEVDAARDGRAVCQQAQSTAYDLILLNICMPERDGFDVMSWLKKTGLDTSVIIISGLSDFHTVRRAFRMGACDYLRKPYDVDELIRVVGTTVLAQGQARRQAAKGKSGPLTGAFFQQALDHLPDLIFSLDDRKHINFLNDRAESFLGFPKEELLGRPFTYLVHAEDVAKIPLLFESNETGEPTKQEIKLRTHDRDVAHLECEITIVSSLETNTWSTDASKSPPTSAHFFGIARDITERKQTFALMEFRASHDSLTGLPNRSLFLDRLALAVSQASRNGQKLAVLFIDLNDFKAVNDTFGHGIGNQLLQRVAVGLKCCLREGDTLSRYGGDEFTVLLPSLDGKNDAATVARKLLGSLEIPFQLEGTDVRVTVGASIGVAMFPDDGIEAEALLECADKAMYGVKQRKKNDFYFYSEFTSPPPSS